MTVVSLSQNSLERVYQNCRIMGEKKELTAPSAIHEMAVRQALGDEADDFLAKEKTVKQAQKNLDSVKKEASEQVESCKTAIAETYQYEVPSLNISDEELAGEVSLTKSINQKLPGFASLTIESKAERVFDVSEDYEKNLVKGLIENLGTDATSLLKIDEKAYLEMDAQKAKDDLESGISPRCSDGVRLVKGVRVKSFRQSSR